MGYLICRTVRFYGMSYGDVMDTPIKVFWALNRNLERIRSEEALVNANTMRAGQTDQEGWKSFVDGHKRVLGDVYKQEQRLDRNALSELKSMMR